MSGILFLVHLGAAVVLAAYGWHRLTLAGRFVRCAKRRAARSTVLSGNYPAVTVQIPLYNERYVAERAIRAAASLDYPSARLDIQVLDDSNDETCDTVDRLVRKLRREGVRVVHLRRRKRDGFKAGALAHGLRRAAGELIAVFDADFVPPADFLRRLVGEFQDPGVGMVQARWSHLNRNASLLTKVQALQLDAHFTIEHGVRSATGCFFNFNGTAGIWRRRAIEPWQTVARTISCFSMGTASRIGGLSMITRRLPHVVAWCWGNDVGCSGTVVWSCGGSRVS